MDYELEGACQRLQGCYGFREEQSTCSLKLSVELKNPKTTHAREK